MAKRFRDTEKGDKEWYMKLTPRLKCAVDFIHDKCDVAGVWSVNMDLLNKYVNDRKKVAIKEILSIDGGRQFDEFAPGKVYSIGFIEFQYGTLSRACKPHLKIFEFLERYGILERVSKGYPKGIHTLKDKEEEKDKEKDMDKEKEKEKEGETFEAKLIHPLQKYIAEECPEVSKLKHQLTYDECISIMAEYPNDVIQDVLDAMDNYKELTQRYISVYRTMENWCKRRLRNGRPANFTTTKKQFTGNNPSDIMHAVREFTKTG